MKNRRQFVKYSTEYAFKHLLSFYNAHLKCIITSFNLGHFSLRKWELQTKACGVLLSHWSLDFDNIYQIK